MRVRECRLVSIILPTYNRAETLSRAVQSVMAQSYEFWELIIIDNHSDDETDELLKTWVKEPRLRTFKIQNNGIIAKSRNMGIRQARGEFIAFLDSDDWWANSKLERCLKKFDEGYDFVFHEMKLVGTKLFYFRNYYKYLLSIKSPKDTDLVCDYLPIFNSSVVVRAASLDKIGEICERKEFVGCEDYDTWIRLKRRGNRFCFVNSDLGCYRLGEDSVSSHPRTITNMTALTRKYINLNQSLPAWIAVTLAQSYLACGDYQRSFKYFLAAVKGDISPIKKLFILLRVIHLKVKLLTYPKVF